MAKNAARKAKLVTSHHVLANEVPLQTEERIRVRAYELYEQRGRADGFAEQDWRQAEQEVVNGKDRQPQAG
jgi:Protein of unknown function (DUF2934)